MPARVEAVGSARRPRVGGDEGSSSQTTLVQSGHRVGHQTGAVRTGRLDGAGDARRSRPAELQRRFVGQQPATSAPIDRSDVVCRSRRRSGRAIAHRPVDDGDDVAGDLRRPQVGGAVVDLDDHVPRHPGEHVGPSDGAAKASFEPRRTPATTPMSGGSSSIQVGAPPTAWWRGDDPAVVDRPPRA